MKDNFIYNKRPCTDCGMVPPFGLTRQKVVNHVYLLREEDALCSSCAGIRETYYLQNLNNMSELHNIIPESPKEINLKAIKWKNEDDNRGPVTLITEDDQEFQSKGWYCKRVIINLCTTHGWEFIEV